MKKCIFIHLAAAFLTITTTGLSEEVVGQQRVSFPKWDFCVAYQVRDADERDARPNTNDEKDPFNERGAVTIPHNLIHHRQIVDVAALSTRTVKSGGLKRETAEGVFRAATLGSKRHPIMECYTPHHIFVFYSHEGQPVAAIEACFTCNRVVMKPEIRERAGTFGPYETADLANLAKIAADAGLSLKPYPTLEAYHQRLKQLDERAKKDVDQMEAEYAARTARSKPQDKEKAQSDSKVRTK
jgi:hypothetical protein